MSENKTTHGMPSTTSKKGGDNPAIVSDSSGLQGDSKTFKKALWDKFDLVIERLQEGRRELKKVHNFFDTLASVKMQYSRGLEKVAAIGKELKTDSSLKKCFTQARIFMEGWASLYETTSTDLNTHVNAKISSMVDEVKEQVSKKQHHHSVLVKELDSLQASYNRKRSRYAEAVQKMIETHALYTEARREGKPHKELQKLFKEFEKCRKAESSYKDKLQTAVLKLRGQQETVATETDVMLEDLEALDRKREHTFKKMMDFYLRLITDVAAFESRGVELQQRAHKAIDIDSDVQNFIKENESHRVPEEFITYEKATAGIQMAELNPITPMSKNVQDGSLMNPSVFDGEQNSRVESHFGSYSEHELNVELDPAKLSDRIAVALTDFLPEEKSAFHFRRGDQFDIVDAPEDDWWTGTHKGKTGSFPSGLVRLENVAHGFTAIDKKCEVLWAFEAENDDELTLLKGDIVFVSMSRDGWCIGKLVKRYGLQEEGKAGLFPMNHIRIDPQKKL